MKIVKIKRDFYTLKILKIKLALTFYFLTT